MEDFKRASEDGFTFKIYRGSRSSLLAFDMDDRLTEKLAGFAVSYQPKGGKRTWIQNRLSFTSKITAATTPKQRKWYPTSEAPLQAFRWSHIPPDLTPGPVKYTATAMMFAKADGSKLDKGPSIDLDLELVDDGFPEFELGFTRGYISSQAFADRFKNQDVRPGKTLDYDTKKYADLYQWAGREARDMLFAFLADCAKDKTCSVDAFIYDCDEPDFVKALQKLGKRLRVFSDDASLHVGPTALEPEVQRRLKASGAAGKTGH